VTKIRQKQNSFINYFTFFYTATHSRKEKDQAASTVPGDKTKHTYEDHLLTTLIFYTASH